MLTEFFKLPVDEMITTWPLTLINSYSTCYYKRYLRIVSQILCSKLLGSKLSVMECDMIRDIVQILGILILDLIVLKVFFIMTNLHFILLYVGN